MRGTSHAWPPGRRERCRQTLHEITSGSRPFNHVFTEYVLYAQNHSSRQKTSSPSTYCCSATNKDRRKRHTQEALSQSRKGKRLQTLRPARPSTHHRLRTTPTHRGLPTYPMQHPTQLRTPKQQTRAWSSYARGWLPSGQLLETSIDSSIHLGPYRSTALVLLSGQFSQLQQ